MGRVAETWPEIFDRVLFCQPLQMGLLKLLKRFDLPDHVCRTMPLIVRIAPAT
jgi:hypothetical protein